MLAQVSNYREFVEKDYEKKLSVNQAFTAVQSAFAETGKHESLHNAIKVNLKKIKFNFVTRQLYTRRRSPPTATISTAGSDAWCVAIISTDATRASR